MMSPLSTSFEAWRAAQPPDPLLDVVVIGSGYGGSVAALRWQEQGRQVVVLERGSEFLPGDFPNDIGQLPKYQRVVLPDGLRGRASGLFEWRPGRSMTTLVANGVGGGSLINAGVVLRPTDEVFAQQAWPAEIRLDGSKARRTARAGIGRCRWAPRITNGALEALAPEQALRGILGR